MYHAHSMSSARCVVDFEANHFKRFLRRGIDYTSGHAGWHSEAEAGTARDAFLLEGDFSLSIHHKKHLITPFPLAEAEFLGWGKFDHCQLPPVAGEIPGKVDAGRTKRALFPGD